MEVAVKVVQKAKLFPHEVGGQGGGGGRQAGRQEGDG